ncbi:MAG: hypothetical protein Q9180_003279 [Flavoplaca navasiana]
MRGDCKDHMPMYSPALEAVRGTGHFHRFDGSFATPNAFKGTPNSNIDAAWADITYENGGVINISEETLHSVNASTEYSVKLAPEIGGGYMASVEVLHQLHCLNMLRQATYEDYYKDKAGPWEDTPQTLRYHLEKSPRTFDEDLSNRSYLRKVPDTDNVDLTATEVQPPKQRIPAKLQSQSQTEHEVGELIDDFSTGSAFIIYCFLEDLHSIQDFLKETWTKYRHVALDLSTCAMTTNLALDLVRRANVDIITQAHMLLGGPRSYEAISILIFYAESFKKGNEPNKMLESDESLKITLFDEFISLPTARILIKFE